MGSSLTETVQTWLATEGYTALALIILVENLFPPIPSEVILPLAGFYVSRGTLAFGPAVLAATIGSLAGALLLYALGRLGGRPLVLRYGRVLRVTDAQLLRAEAWFERFGDAVVLFGRMVPGARSIVSIPAGMARMSLVRFVLLTTIGSAAWNALLIGTGRALGDNWERVSAIVSSASRAIYALLAAALALAAVWLWRNYQRRRA